MVHLEIMQAALDWSQLPVRPTVFTIPGFHLGQLDLGPFSLRWYSLAYIAGIIFAWWLMLKMLRRPGPPANRDQIDAFITWATVGVIAGGRLGYVLFYNLDQYARHPMDIFRLWDGGMSFHGGMAGVVLAALAFGAANRVSGIRILDYIAAVAPMGLLLGRLANFANGELWGRPTGSEWGIIFPDAGPEPRYPSQLFEAASEGLLLLVLLQWLFWRTEARRYPGLLAGLFGVGYAVSRFVVEYYREPDHQLLGFAERTGLTMGQTLTLPMFAAGVALIAYAGVRGRAAASA